ncbi:melanoma-associated antigen B4 [Cricetulus griseus]|uniref:Melanoma-associated antigen B4 n=1 Tax=Cricetulus griseus TaxID=10029 RepID=A0A9J7GJ03_CRIGR|nr:melanoma-associated antigen B4 [Cricetulus griseus]ERE65055.1 melanoma-associated antigen B4-like protein [Cricetulus griseus]
MPRGKKSKARAREKRRQIHDEAHGQNDAQAKAAEKEESPACSDQGSGDGKPSNSAGFPEGKAPTITPSKGMHCRSGKGAKGKEEKQGRSLRAPKSTESMQMDLISRKAGMLVEYMLCKYKIKQPARRGEMLKIINKRFKEHFPEILKKASYRLDMVFGLELKEIQPNGQSYMLVSKLDFEDDGSRSNEMGLPNRGILIPLLSVIYLNGYCAPEEEVWHFLNMLGVHDGVPHLIFGDIRKLITEELVQEKYLEYRQVPGSDPPSYEFLWGPRAYVETSKKKVMDFLAKVNETMPGAYSSRYEQALIEEEEKARAEAAAKPGTKGKGRSKTK